ncbi:hypothetical protein [Glutamicibacter arilaitensis]|uniref:hypothetical protein n=1 Tax=Glutamicibacter arilaitensis TaxID=256701 RepID=UPI003FD1921B
MSTVIEARRLNGTDTGKTVEFPPTKGTLESITHGSYEVVGGKKMKYVGVMLDGQHHVLMPSDKITITGQMKKPAVQP